MSESITVSWPKPVGKVNEYELRVQLAIEKRHSAALATENARLEEELTRMRNAQKRRVERDMMAYDAYLRANADDKARFPRRLALYMALPLLGLFGGTIVTLLICLGRIL